MKGKKDKFYDPKNRWGGPWTEKKLDTFCKYVKSYLMIMKNNSFWETIYFDGFAGSGEIKKEEPSEFYRQLKLTEDDERGYKGSAQRVIELDDTLKFSFYYFIDTNKESLDRLATKLKTLPASNGKNLEYRPGDANKWLSELSTALNTKKYAALVFLDPFGMQIDWKSIESLKGTRSDVWILLPTAIIVNRLLDKKGELKYSKKLETFFGMSKNEIEDTFYVKSKQQTLFGEETSTTTKVSNPIEKIATIYVKQMKGIWKFVTERPLRLDNAQGTPLFHFVFASNNKAALKIANEIIISV